MRGIFQRLHSVVVGPGMGRDEHMQRCGKIAIEVRTSPQCSCHRNHCANSSRPLGQLARENDVYIVVDADGLWLVNNEPEVVMGYKKCVLTPNVMEFGRLCKKMNIDADQSNEENAAKQLAQALNGPTILEKGRIDRITNGKDLIYCDEQGGLKRAGGQGDILSGCLGTFLAWASIYANGVGAPDDLKERIPEERLPLIAAYGGAITTRTCSREGFKRLGRAMLADDLLQEVGPAYARCVPLLQSAMRSCS